MIKKKEILIKPILTEKAVSSGINSYTFEVSKKANKIEIKKAFEERYGKKPLKVNVTKVSGKKTRWGRSVGRTKDFKKAIVYLKKGEKIELK